MESLVTAPVVLGEQTRAAFREEAFAALSRLAADVPEDLLVIDLGATQHVDSAGLGVLVAVQRQAADQRHGVVLRRASEEIRFLLLMTKLDDRFVIET